MATPHQFSKIHGKNIVKAKNHPSGINTLKWKFSESQGIAFSDFLLKENRKYEAIFNGSGHASIGLTQTDPENLKSFSEAIEKSQIVVLTDIRFHRRTCIVDIVKRDDGTGFVFETHYQKGTTQKKTLVHTAEVWIVVCLKFGNISAELKDKENQAALRFHRKHDKNITLTRERYKISLTVPYPLAYAFIGDAIEKGQSIHVQARHVDDNEKPRQYHLRIGISNTTAISSDDLQFSLNVVHKLERDICIGDFYICVTKRGQFHIWKDDVCLFVRDLSMSSVNPSKPLYVCFEIVRICLETVGISGCTHKAEGIENPGPSVGEDKPYVTFYHVDSLRNLNQKLSDGQFTAEDVQTINNIPENITEYANSVVADVDHEHEATDDDYLITVSAPLRRIVRQEKRCQDPQESDDRPTLTIIYEMLVKMARTAEKQHLERGASMADLQAALQKKIESIEMIQKCFKPPSPSQEKARRHAMDSFCSHLRTICADFIQNAFAFPLCDYLLQHEILHLEQYTTIRHEHKRQPTEANRTLFHFLSRKNYTHEQLKNIKEAFIETKQEHFLPQ